MNYVSDDEFVAFDVSLTRHFTGKKTWDKVVYNKVNVNIGGAYNNGDFICPLDGVYEFIWMSLSHRGKYADTAIFLNGTKKRFNYNYEPTGKTYNLSTTSQIFHLKKGDKVWIATYPNHMIFGDGNEHSSFQGKLLHAD